MDNSNEDLTSQSAGKAAGNAPARMRLSPGFWQHDLTIPLSMDLAPASLFQRHRHYLVFDLETKTLVDAVGGWKNFKQLEVSIGCAYDSKTDEVLVFHEKDMADLCRLCEERLVVGYNVVGFDLPILEKYGLKMDNLDVFDIMLEVQSVSNWRFVKLEKVAQATLGTGKSAEGTMAVEWWEQGKIDKIIEYCKQDVVVTRDVFQFGMNNGYIKIQKAEGEAAQFPVNWT